MKVHILAGGLGTRISEETINKPKPMIEIEESLYNFAHHEASIKNGINNFIVCLGVSEHYKRIFENFRLL